MPLYSFSLVKLVVLVDEIILYNLLIGFHGVEVENLREGHKWY